MVEFEIFATAYIIGGSLVAYQIGYVAGIRAWVFWLPIDCSKLHRILTSPSPQEVLFISPNGCNNFKGEDVGRLQSKDLDSNPGTVESVSFYTQRLQIFQI